MVRDSYNYSMQDKQCEKHMLFDHFNITFISQKRLWQKLFQSYQVLCFGFLSCFLFCFTMWSYDLVIQFNEQYPMNCSTALHLKSFISLPKSLLSPGLFSCGCFKTLFPTLFFTSNPYQHPLLLECFKRSQMEQTKLLFF